jgi:hypothetical protein
VAILRLLSFANAILTTTMNWGDATLARLPGVRDRVVEVSLEPGTGGLNIRMTTEQIDGLAELGADAAVLLLKRFAGRAPTRAGDGATAGTSTAGCASTCCATASPRVLPVSRGASQGATCRYATSSARRPVTALPATGAQLHAAQARRLQTG